MLVISDQKLPVEKSLEARIFARHGGKLRLWLGNLDKFTAAGLLVSGTAGLSADAQTLDPAGATQE